MSTNRSTSKPGTSLSLLSRVRSDDPVAWSSLVDLYAPLVASWCLRRGLGIEDTDDVIQNVFISVARGLETFRHDGNRDGSFRAWLWTITRNRILDVVRARRPDRAVGGSSAAMRLGQVMDQAIDEEEPTSQLDLNQLLRRAMSQIEATVERQTWQAFWRTVVDGQSSDVVAAELNLSTATIRQYRSRILRRLREQMGDC
ncbi:MAG: sigma-70 family RNA polymerase sigma factor [Pirellulaceae bacterium]